jgi:hypothetical protein
MKRQTYAATAKRSILECAASWPGITIQQLIEEGELSHTPLHLVSAVSELRREGLLCDYAHPSVLYVKPGWEERAEGMLPRDRSAAAAIASGAHTYRVLCEVLGRSSTSMYHTGSRLIRNGVVYNPRGLYLTEEGSVLFIDTPSDSSRLPRLSERR